MTASSATTTIHAAPEVVWHILTDAPAYPLWEPEVDRIDGTIAPGKRITVFTTYQPTRGVTFRVTEFVANRRMTWASGLPLGLYRRLRTFTLNPIGDDRVQITSGEEFSGPLLPRLAGSLPDLTNVTKRMSEFVVALAARAEEL